MIAGWVPAPRVDDLVAGPWGARFRGRQFPCAHGRGGFTADKREGDGATPICVTHLRRIWRPAKTAASGGPIPCTIMGPDLGWGDDPARPGYNAPVALSKRGCKGAERMLRPDRLYRLVAETGWNAETPRPGKGSAIFLHVWRGPRTPTAGCIAFREADLVWILAHWTARSRLFLTG
ncbi:MAG: L,D-peptidoglycan transpeptidase YkuD (ErfK/YbiS/YcfS/YnhG family) [Paracoccaceae bacterium]